jgi:hypothetical protein
VPHADADIANGVQALEEQAAGAALLLDRLGLHWWDGAPFDRLRVVSRSSLS